MPTSLYVGIDIGKSSHVAAFLSQPLLKRHRRVESCPVVPVQNSRTGFDALLRDIKQHAPDTQCCAILERTGHYGLALEQFLVEHGVVLYRINAAKRYARDKSDKRDARALSVLLYNQVELSVLVTDKSQVVHRLVPANATARALRGLSQHRNELSRELVKRQNKLTAICDELFPELTQVYKDPNKPSALSLRMKYPSPQAIIDASLDDLYKTRLATRPSRKALAELQQLAVVTIGTKDASRHQSLLFEQRQLIAEFHLLSKHIDELDTEIKKIVSQSREGRILTSFTGVGPVQAATLISRIGSIANFEQPCHLRAYLGWAPQESQTGTTHDDSTLKKKSGNSILKRTMCLVAMSAVKYDPKWRALYLRLVPLKCTWDERKRVYKGRMKVIGRVAGQIIKVMFVLLKKDHDLLQSLKIGEDPPEPELYNASLHAPGSSRPTN